MKKFADILLTKKIAQNIPTLLEEDFQKLIPLDVAMENLRKEISQFQRK